MMKLIITPYNAKIYNDTLWLHLPAISKGHQVGKSMEILLGGYIGEDTMNYLQLLVEAEFIDSFEVRRN